MTKGKNYKYVISAGCSYTFVSYEEDDPLMKRYNALPKDNYIDGVPPKTSFIKELGKLLGAESYNLAKNGLSFKFILYYSFLWIQNNMDKVKDSLLIVGLTHRRRETFWNPSNNGGLDIEGVGNVISPFLMPTRPHTREDIDKTGEISNWIDDTAERLGITTNKYLDFLEVFWDKLDDPIQRDTMDEMYMVMLQNYCNNIGLDILFIDMANEAYKWPNMALKDWKEVVYPLFIWPDNSPSWRHYIIDKNGYDVFGHPNYNDHVQLASILYKYIHDKK